MAFIADTWVSPIDIIGTMKINQTDEALQNIVSDDQNSIANYLNTEMGKVEDEINPYGSRLDALENVVEW